MAVSLKAVHCISVRKIVFPQTFVSELCWVIGKSKDFSFCKYVKIIFLELKTIIAGKRINLSVQGQKIAQIKKLAAQRPPNVTKYCYDPYIKRFSNGKNCTLLLIYFFWGILKIYQLINNYSPKAKWILSNNPRDEVEGIIRQYSLSLRRIIVLV